MKKAIVLFSGGIDSTTCLAMAIQRFGSECVVPLSISYGQKHQKEIESARKILDYYHVEGVELDLAPLFAYSDCSLLSHSAAEIPEASYSSQLEKTDGTPVSTYVPFRNGLFLSSAAGIALSLKCSYIYYGAHSDDGAGSAYPDCSQSFHQSMSAAVYEGSGRQLEIIAPFISLTKADVVKKGLELKAPYELTWSCYEGGKLACGKCGTCIDRINAFKTNGVSDPIPYATAQEGGVNREL